MNNNQSSTISFAFSNHQIIRAGAGTGKTHALVTQYLHLCAGFSGGQLPIPPNQILAMTFTNKAALELKERITHRIKQLIQSPLAEEALNFSAQELNKNVPSSEFWEKSLAILNRSTISTFHSFAHGLCKEFASLVHLPQNFDIIQEDKKLYLLEESCQTILFQAMRGELVSDQIFPNELLQLSNEYEITGTQEQPGLLYSMIELIQTWPAQNFSFFIEPPTIPIVQSNILNLIEELSSQSFYLSDSSQLIIQEIYSNFQRDINLFGLPEKITKLRAKKDTFAQQYLAHWKNRVKRSFEEYLAVQISDHHRVQFSVLRKLVQKAAIEYQTIKKKLSLVDYDDLIEFAYQILTHPLFDSNYFFQAYQAILIDEFQDTSPSQIRLISTFFEKIHGTAKQPLFYIVGDPKQSIYQFRGADLPTFERFCNQLLNQGAELQVLNISRRSTPRVITFINRLFKQVMSRPENPSEINEYTQIFNPTTDELTAWHKDSKTSEIIWLKSGSDDNPTAPKRTTKEKEAIILSKQVQQLLLSGVKANDIAVLLRKTTHLTTYLKELKNLGISFHIAQDKGFYSYREILDIVAVLQLILCPSDSYALVCTLRSPFCNISDQSIVQLATHHLLELTLWDDYIIETLPISPLEQKTIAQFKKSILQMSRILNLYTPSIFMNEFYECFGLNTEKILSQYDAPYKNLSRLLRKSVEASVKAMSCPEFIHDLKLKTHYQSSDIQPNTALTIDEIVPDDAIQIMTIHQSKGLEFQTVIIPGCTDKERISIQSIDYDPQIGMGLHFREANHPEWYWLQIKKKRTFQALAESKRLFYVATTRAKNKLYFIGEGRIIKDTWADYLEQFTHSSDAHLMQQTIFASEE